MAATNTADVEYGKISEEGLAKIRARIGHGFENRRPWRTEVTVDAIYHLALAIGDLHPLYIDEAYAAKSKWGTLLAPPIMIQCFDTLRAVGSAGLPEGLPGVHSIWSGSMYEFDQPLRCGDKVRSKSYLKDVREVESKFAGGRTVFQTYEAEYWNQKDEKLGVRQDTWIRNERHTTKKTAKYSETELATWTLDQIHELWKAYDTEERTVARKWADVQVGDKLSPILKGPLTPTAEIAFESFFGVYLVGNKVASNLYKRHPKLMIPNEQGVPEPPQRVHWDNQFTKNLLGLPGAYDLGPERCAWLMQGATNWMGDDGILRKIEAQYRKFNYMGDVTWMRGEVTGKERVDGRNMVTLEVRCENHRDEVTAKARIEVELP